MTDQDGHRGPHRRDVLAGAVAATAAALTPIGLATAQPAVPPRNRTMTLVWGGREGRWVDFDLWNPYSIGSNHQNGPNIIYEPLAYYSAFADKTYMWLAESYQYTPDFKQLTIKTRSGISWSDGTPFSAEDVAFTLNSLRDIGPKVKWGVDVQQVMKEAKATDANTVVVDFVVPAPRFFFFMTYKYDIGVYIVPKHIFAGQDWTTFKHFDIAKGWPVSTGPWKVVDASLQQKVFDRRPEWWAVKAGLAPLPAIERTIWLPYAGEQATAQALITNQLDAATGMQPATFPTVFRGNPKITTHTGQKPPYGYVDWWPISLYLNNEVKPFDDKDVRWALSHYIDRQQLIEVGYLGASQVSSLPMPAVSAAAAVFRRGEGPAGEIRHAGVRSEEGRRAAVGQGIQEGFRRRLGRRAGQEADAGHHRFRRVGTGDRAGAVGNAEAPRRRDVDEHAARLRRSLPEGPVSSARSTAMAARSTSRIRCCGFTRVAASRCPARTW